MMRSIGPAGWTARAGDTQSGAVRYRCARSYPQDLGGTDSDCGFVAGLRALDALACGPGHVAPAVALCCFRGSQVCVSEVDDNGHDHSLSIHRTYQALAVTLVLRVDCVPLVPWHAVHITWLLELPCVVSAGYVSVSSMTLAMLAACP